MPPPPGSSFTDRNSLEAISRQAARSAYFGENTTIARVLGKYTLWLDTRDTELSPHLCLDGFWEAWITLAMMRSLRPGWRCLDIGAHLGYYTMIMADAVGPSGRVIAVEPNPQLNRLLQHSIRTNGFPGWTTLCDRAVTNTDGEEIELVVPGGSLINGSVAIVAGEADQTMNVETITLNNLARELGRVDLIKIDAEGSEQDIWTGGLEAIRANPEVLIIMEINCARYGDPEGFLRAIEAEGFPLRFIAHDGSSQPATAQRILADHPAEDVMLYLRR